MAIIIIMSKDLENKLREAIINSKMSRYKISQLSEVSEAQLSLFVNGKRTLTLTSASKVAAALGMDLKFVKKGR